MIYVIAYIAIGLILCFLAGWTGAYAKEKNKDIFYMFLAVLWPVCIPCGLAAIGEEIGKKP